MKLIIKLQLSREGRPTHHCLLPAHLLLGIARPSIPPPQKEGRLANWTKTYNASTTDMCCKPNSYKLIHFFEENLERCRDVSGLIPVPQVLLCLASFLYLRYYCVWPHSCTSGTTVSGLIPVPHVQLCLASFLYLRYYCVWPHSCTSGTTVSGLIPVPQVLLCLASFLYLRYYCVLPH